MSAPASIPAPASYVPGYVRSKRAMLAAGIVVFVLGVAQLWTPLGLVLFGARARAEAIRVVKEKPGVPAVVLTDDVQVKAQGEPDDRSYVFWNEFRFHTRDGRAVEVRAGSGSRVRPLYALSDADGLPTTDLICYDPHHPERAVFPFVLSVWVAPCVLILAGTLCAIIGAVLLTWARRPIELPHLPPAGEPDTNPPSKS